MVIKEDVEHVRILRLANPPSNILNLSLLETLKKEVAEARREEGVRCLVLASSYPRYFSTGLDLPELGTLPADQRTRPFEALLEVYQSLRELPKPSLASISGSALLGGWIIAMGCDFRLMSREAGKLALSEIRLGLSPGPALICRLRELSGSPGLVKDVVLRGRTLRAEEALAGGFVDSLHGAGELEEAALREAKALSRLPLPAYGAIKRALHRRPPGEEAALLAESREEVGRLFGTAEAREGVAAMIEKRRPRWER